MNRIRAFFATRTGRLIVHDGTLALGAGLSAWEAAGQSLTWGAAVAAGVVAGKAFLRLILPVPAASSAAPASKSFGHHTVQIHADTSQAIAALNDVRAAAEQASKAVAGVGKGAPKSAHALTAHDRLARLVADPMEGLDYRLIDVETGRPIKPPTVHDRLALLHPPSGRKGGALPSPRDDRDWQAKLPKASTVPASVDYGAGITWGMLLNDRLSDCYEAAILHALQVLTGYQPMVADALAVYEQVTGYDPHRTDANGNNPTDQGTYGRQLFDWARGKGLIASYAAVPTDRASVKAAIFAHKAVLCEWALPVGAETEGDVWTMPRTGRAAGSWGGHATVETGYTTRRNRNVTWGEYGTVTPPFEDAYLQAAWVVTVAPGTNVAAIMAKVRAG